MYFVYLRKLKIEFEKKKLNLTLFTLVTASHQKNREKQIKYRQKKKSCVIISFVIRRLAIISSFKKFSISDINKKMTK
jgi:hypothetical protein